ncbi:MAG: hypothetical protein WDO72_01880 [Pseudomonadota bacterium]
MRLTVRPSLVVLGTIFVLPMAVYSIYFVWDTHRLRSFCGELRPGTPVAQVAQIAARHGVDQKSIIDSRKFSADAKDQRMIAVAPSTMGEMGCDIKLNGAEVVSAILSGS